MPINFSDLVYSPTQDVFGRTVTFTPTKSQPNASAYDARGIFSTEPVDVETEDGVVFSDNRVILDIREVEFSVVPIQGDHVAIPGDSGIPAEGGFVVIDTKRNGGGETTLTLRKWVENKPA